MVQVYLSLGSNLGHSHITLSEAVAKLRLIGSIAAVSSLYRTAAWGVEDQPDFLNLALEMETALQPMPLLAAVQQIEAEMGRERIVRWGARTLDIDILFYGSSVMSIDKLQIPHPLLQDRRFVLEPLEEIAPGFIHPVLHKTISTLLTECTDGQPVQRLYSL